MTLTIEVPAGFPVLILRNLSRQEANELFRKTLFLAAAHQSLGYDVPRGQVRKDNA